MLSTSKQDTCGRIWGDSVIDRSTHMQLGDNPCPRYSTMQQEVFRLSKVSSAARVAASNTSSTPSPVRDEHSRYFRAPIWAAVSLPSLGVTNRSDFFRISSTASVSSRRSFFNPTMMMGTPGHRSLASSIHCKNNWLNLTVLGGQKKRQDRPCVSRSPMNRGYPRRILSGSHVPLNMLAVVIVRNPLGQQYPTMPIALTGHRLGNPSRSSRKPSVPRFHT